MKKPIQGCFIESKLGYGMAFWGQTESFEAELESLREYERKKKILLTPEVKYQIFRLDTFLKEELKVIPSIDYTVDWLYRKLKWGKAGIEIRSITDDELIVCAKEYLGELKHRLQITNEKQRRFRWLESTHRIDILFNELVEHEYIAKDSCIDSFRSIFFEEAVFEKKLVWLKKCKGQPSKKSLLEMFELLDQNSFINIGKVIGQEEFNIVSYYFVDVNRRILKFSYSNKSTISSRSQNYYELEAIVQNLSKA